VVAEVVMSESPRIDPIFWRAVEALHSVVYFADGAVEEYSALGLRGFWRGYFASRAAAMGRPSAELVTATFFGFAPAFVARAVPEVWEVADPIRVLEARRRVARGAWTSSLGEEHPIGQEPDRLVELARAADLAGKPLAAAHAALEIPARPHERLWYAATVLRELHGDCHVAVLVADGLDGAEANVLAQATQRKHRGWSEEQWEAAVARLQSRGWVSRDRVATTEGRRARQEIEQRTHGASNASLPEEVHESVVALTPDLTALARRLESHGPLTYPNPTGVPRP
jgi:hypothetical protein